MGQIHDVIERNIKLGVHAPQFPYGLDWFNVNQSLAIEDLRGKVVLLDFWTFCCINCMHIIPDLKKLEAKYPNELVVVGVHSAKFDNEKASENIRKSILRYELKHPVVNDHDMVLWRQYAVSSWPTLALVDTEGRVVLQVSGEGNYEVLDQAIAELIRLGKRDSTLKSGPFALKLEQDGMESSPLRFPGKIRAYADRLVIADSNHNQILVTDLNGNILETIGSGREGKKDEKFSEAEFNHPQGVALDGDFIYVTDTENHLLRRADLKKKTVETVAGTGVQAPGRVQTKKPFKGLDVPLNSPWDIVKIGDDFYIAMAGAHQIWKFYPQKGTVEPYAGNGGESILDGPLSFSAFSQPSGLATDGKAVLYVADSEVSAARYVDVNAGRVRTLVGTGLFNFGDRDGDFDTALFQHGLAIDVRGDKVYFADTYNDRIKELDLKKKTVKSIFGSGQAGYRDGKGADTQFYEPGGLSVLGDKIYVADTNNHKIRVCDLKTGEVTTLVVKAKANAASSERIDEIVPLPAQSVAAGKIAAISVAVELSKEFEFTKGAPLQIRVISPSGEEKWKQAVSDPAKNLPARGRIDVGLAGKSEIQIILDVYYCDAKSHALCHFKTIKLIQPLEVTAAGSAEIRVNYKISK
ncbi:MAG: redoxin domain-containing protein [Candidatus Omnitrophica bacterium]|nr:redoxin domain-containing protein [Candidatus Omnitrophota bacterium]